MANETHYVTSAYGQHDRVGPSSRPLPADAVNSPSLHYEEEGARVPPPPPHRTSTMQYDQHRSQHLETAGDATARYPKAQMRANNYFSRKPIRASSIRREPLNHVVDVSSSVPLSNAQRPPARDTHSDSLMDYEYHNTTSAANPAIPQPFHSSYRFSLHPPHTSHPLQLLPTPIHAPRTFTFELEPESEDPPRGPYHTPDELIRRHHTHRRRHTTYREISSDALGMALSHTSAPALRVQPAPRPPPEQYAQDWRARERYAHVFGYDGRRGLPAYKAEEEEEEEFVNAQEGLDRINPDRGRDVSYYFDAVEEQQQQQRQQRQQRKQQMENGEDMEWKEPGAHARSDLVISESLPQEPAETRRMRDAHARPARVEDHHRHLSTRYGRLGDGLANDMVEVRSPGTAGKIIEAARKDGYCG